MQADGFGSKAQVGRYASPTGGPPWQLQVCEVVNRDGSRFPEVVPPVRREASKPDRSCEQAASPRSLLCSWMRASRAFPFFDSDGDDFPWDPNLWRPSSYWTSSCAVAVLQFLVVLPLTEPKSATPGKRRARAQDTRFPPRSGGAPQEPKKDPGFAKYDSTQRDRVCRARPRSVEWSPQTAGSHDAPGREPLLR